MPEAWLLLVVGLCILAAVAIDVGYTVSRQPTGNAAAPANAYYPLPGVSGALQLHDPIYAAGFTPVGGPCKGLGAYDGLLGGTPVVVKDQTGSVLATGALDIGKVVGASTCEFSLVLPALPKADLYQFDVAGRTLLTSRYDELASRGWDVTLSLG